jgi:L-fuconolactonase
MRLTRRAFTAACAAAALAPAAARSGIIDTHTHFYDPRRPEGVPWPPKTDELLYQPYLPSRFAELVRPLGVTGTIVVEASAWLADNQWVLDLAKENPIVRGFVGHLDPAEPDFAANLTRFARNPLFRGIRLGESALRDALNNRASLERLAAADLALDAIGAAPLFTHLVKLTDRIPNLRVIIDHLPFPLGEHADAFRELGSRPQVFAKVSGTMHKADARAPLDQLWATFGEDRLVYASNWPVSERAAPYAEVLALVSEYFESKGSTAADKFFHQNSRAIYKWR